MPLPSEARYRFKNLPGGKKIRLAFKKGTNKVIEAKKFSKNKKGILKKDG